MARGQKEKRFNSALNLPISAEMKAAIEAVADASDMSIASVARDALQRGLPLTRDSLRRKARKAQRKAAGVELDSG